MKKLYFLLLLVGSFAGAQNVFIPDAAFKSYLVAFADWDIDGEISVAEAQNIAYIDLNNMPAVTNLTGIESFPNLQFLKLSGTNVTSVNLSANTLMTGIDFSNSQLTSLNLSGLSLMGTIYGTNAPIASLNLTGCTALTLISMTGTPLTALDFSSCPNVNNIYVPSNQLNSLVFGPNVASGIQLNCSANNLPSLNVSSLAGLTQLFCDNNNISAMDFTNNIHLQWLNVSFNNLTTLDISNCSEMINFGCDNNNLVTLFMKNGALENTTLANNPNLEFVCADTGQITTIQAAAGAGVVVNSYCSFVPGGDYNTITGEVHFDAAGNNCSDDPDMPYIKLNITDGPNTGSTFTTTASVYNFYTGAGNFTVTPDLENPAFFTASPANTIANFPNTNNNIHTQDFCLSANGVHRDVEVAIAPLVPARPGFDAQYKIVYKNKGNQTHTGAVTFAYNDNVLNLVSAVPVQSIAAVGLLTFNYVNLLPFESRSIIVTLHVNAPTDTPAVNIDDMLDFTANVTLNGIDELPTDNTMNLHQIVVGAYDPNDKICVEGNVVSPTEIGNYLHYTINFENTGTEIAQNVVVVDMINTAQFDVSSLRIMSSSHPVDIRVTGNKVEFIFRNINLAIGGHGNILLKLKTRSNLVAGAVVSNKADIYFDCNFPVATDFANTAFQTLGINDPDPSHSIAIYPNPAHDVINIKSAVDMTSIQLFDIQGRLLQAKIANDTEATIDLSGKQNGVYFLRITSENGIKTEKVVKQ